MKQLHRRIMSSHGYATHRNFQGELETVNPIPNFTHTNAQSPISSSHSKRSPKRKQPVLKIGRLDSLIKDDSSRPHSTKGEEAGEEKDVMVDSHDVRKRGQTRNTMAGTNTVFASHRVPNMNISLPRKRRDTGSALREYKGSHDDMKANQMNLDLNGLQSSRSSSEVEGIISI